MNMEVVSFLSLLFGESQLVFPLLPPYFVSKIKQVLFYVKICLS